MSLDIGHNFVKDIAYKKLSKYLKICKYSIIE